MPTRPESIEKAVSRLRVILEQIKSGKDQELTHNRRALRRAKLPSALGFTSLVRRP
jgi:hypothetical protein